MSRVFISSTSEDLEAYRAKARDAAIGAGLFPVMMEYFTPTGARPPLAECMAKISGCDVLVVIVAHRYGWKPPGGSGKSITWLECEEAVRRGCEVLAFLVDDKCEWPPRHKDSHRIAEAVESGNATTKLLTEVQGDIKKLGEFKKWLNGRGIRGTFSTPEELHRKIEAALRERLGPVATTSRAQADPAVYLEQLREQSSWIDIRGLQVGTGKAHRFPIEELYIPLTMAGAAKGHMPLEGALAHSRLVVVGDPGSGKSTFLRHVALSRVNDQTMFPIFIRISELTQHIRRQKDGSWAEDSPFWLTHFLAARSAEFNQGLSEHFFRETLVKGPAVLLLDGLDEAPSAQERESIVSLFEKATQPWRQCRFVVTTRPLAYQGRIVLAGFETAQIEPLETAMIETFLDRWCRALFRESAAAATRHLGQLKEALRSVPEIRRMARNPVMLTALAVVHRNENRLPQQRADLYESILNWLARAREKRPGRESAERCLILLQRLALAMQRAPKGRQVQVEKGCAAEVLAPSFEGATEAERRDLAFRFLEQEEVDSGIVVSRGAVVRFRHLTFQDHLAAREIAGMVDADQWKLLLDEDRIYRPEWREVALLLAGILAIRQGLAKVDALFEAVLGRMGQQAGLAAKARCAGLLGTMVNDLRSLDYQPADMRYPGLMDAVLGIFDREKASSVEFSVRLGAAEALGQAGDPRIGRDNWVRIEAYEIGMYPVTVSEYRRFVEDEGYRGARWWKAGGYDGRVAPGEWEEQVEHPNRPVTFVSWYEASAYCAWAGGRLPTEEEWERAACGISGGQYPWGTQAADPSRANYGELIGHPTPVGLYPEGATQEGIVDLAGNVWEWVEDRVEDCNERRLRGGSWLSKGTTLGAALSSRPDGRADNIGFRLARDVLVP